MDRKPQRRRFSRELKIEAVRLASQEGVPVSQVARDLGVGATVLRRWRVQYEADREHAFGGPGRVSPRDAALVGMKRERVHRRRYRSRADARVDLLAISEFPKWRKYLISLSGINRAFGLYRSAVLRRT